MNDIHIEKTLEWIDARIDTLQGDLGSGLIETDEERKMAETWIDDLDEVGKRLSTSARMCRKYHGRWSPRTRFCF